MPVIPYCDLVERMLKREKHEICFAPGAAFRSVIEDAGQICMEALTDEVEIQVYTGERRGSAHLIGRTFANNRVCGQYLSRPRLNFCEIGPLDLAEIIMKMVESFRNKPAKFEVISKIRTQNASIFEPDLQFSSGVFSSIREAKAAFLIK
ncbi:hypothetical protein KTR66_20860 [Roseococcus sp. SDR]|uniref:hypothetical protein n=1 Tax=Roseococcus sp. SDR TaxID=2835532 RepID=UPI001BCEFE0B|nr:hypothetical protein [Roseococcus sp. SDR]MBS7792456.1 hypothetical protein [Roseococcus sp. SDR]MBV1847770.1 hypothetical protein [Roseococcus sp. SDR]